uniref:hypothetical protein n=1 Tax=Acetomicrobium sp. S15 = DSM 107314 TaxID=2529858 RepID=UPI0018E0D179
VGKKADFILVRLEENDPLVITTVTEGKIVLTYNYHDPSHLEGVLASVIFVYHKSNKIRVAII